MRYILSILFFTFFIALIGQSTVMASTEKPPATENQPTDEYEEYNEPEC